MVQKRDSGLINNEEPQKQNTPFAPTSWIPPRPVKWGVTIYTCIIAIHNTGRAPVSMLIRRT